MGRGKRRAIFLVSVLLAAGCGPDVANRHSRGVSVVCFGDSLTQGVGATPGNDYPSRLARALNREVINAGVSGDTTANGLARLEQDVLSKNPRLVIVVFGGNDFLQGVPTERTFQNIDEMVRRIQDAGAMVVLVGVRSGLLSNAAESRYKHIAKTRRAAFVPDILEDVWAKPSKMSDGIHPNDVGYALIAERILEEVEPLLKEP